MIDEYVTKCVVDPVSRKFYLYSNEGSTKEISCETVDQFMNVLSFIKDTYENNLLDAELVYAEPLTIS
jgi:hypothetical protein